MFVIPETEARSYLFQTIHVISENKSIKSYLANFSEARSRFLRNRFLGGSLEMSRPQAYLSNSFVLSFHSFNLKLLFIVRYFLFINLFCWIHFPFLNMNLLYIHYTLSDGPVSYLLEILFIYLHHEDSYKNQ